MKFRINSDTFQIHKYDQTRNLEDPGDKEDQTKLWQKAS